MKNVVVVEGVSPDPRLIAALAQKVDVLMVTVTAEQADYVDNEGVDIASFAGKFVEMFPDIDERTLSAHVQSGLSMMKFESERQAELSWLDHQRLAQIKLEIDALKTYYKPIDNYEFSEELPPGAKIPKKFLQENHRITKVRYKK